MGSEYQKRKRKYFKSGVYEVGQGDLSQPNTQSKVVYI
jgi:hypothetical protein